VEYKDSKGQPIEVGATVLVPCRVVKLVGNTGALVQLESLEAYGHINPNVKDKLQGRTRTAFWAEPGQIEVQQA
jgi:hypothetical protein